MSDVLTDGLPAKKRHRSFAAATRALQRAIMCDTEALYRACDSFATRMRRVCPSISWFAEQADDGTDYVVWTVPERTPGGPAAWILAPHDTELPGVRRWRLEAHYGASDEIRGEGSSAISAIRQAIATLGAIAVVMWHATAVAAATASPVIAVAVVLTT